MTNGPLVIDKENVLNIDIPSIALDERFGSLKFESAVEKLTSVQKYLKEAHDLNFKDLLLTDQINQVENYQAQLINHLQWLQRFDLSTSANPKAEHDAFENQILGFYNDMYRTVVMSFLPFLREERRRQNPKEKTLDEDVRQATQLRTDLQEELRKVREETEKIRLSNREVGAAKGERAAVQMAAHFDAEVSRYQSAANGWYTLLQMGYLLILAIILGFGFWYWLGYASLTWQSAAAKLVFVAALWYGLAFIIRNYNINSHLAAVNRHRAAVARTLEDFIVVEQQQSKPRLSDMLKNSTEAMFKNIPIGFISKSEKDTSSPIYEVINNIMGLKNG